MPNIGGGGNLDASTVGNSTNVDPEPTGGAKLDGGLALGNVGWVCNSEVLSSAFLIILALIVSISGKPSEVIVACLVTSSGRFCLICNGIP